jgi:LPS export ABC transporter protein LptC
MPGFPGKAGGGQRLSAACLRVLAGLACACLSFAGCSMDYRATQAEEKTAGGVPDTVAIGIVHKIYKNGHLSLVLEAARAETFNSQKKTLLSNARFEELDDKGAMATEGRASTIVFHSDTENAEISGSVRVRSASEKALVSAQSLVWENKQKRLSAPASETVVVKKDDGSFIQGTGFVGDFRTREVTFTGRVEGRYVWQRKK